MIWLLFSALSLVNQYLNYCDLIRNIGSMEAVWKELKAAIKQRIPVHSYKMWIEPIRFSKSQDGRVVLSCPNTFSKKRVQENYKALIESEIEKTTGKPCRLSQEFDDLHQLLLGLIHPRSISEGDTDVIFHVNLCLILSQRHKTRLLASHASNKVVPNANKQE